MKRQISLSILVPVYNERFLVEEALQRLLPLAREAAFSRVQVVVVDDASSDGSGEILARLARKLPNRGRLRFKFLRHGRNQGKGAAFRTALAAAEEEISLVYDADLEYQAEDIPALMEPFLRGQADAVYGSRFMPRRFRRLVRWRHSLINAFLSWVARWLTDLSFSDAYTCYKAARTSLLQSIPFSEDDFRFDAEYTIKVAKRGARIFEVPISYTGRSPQEGKKISWRDGYRGLMAYLKHAWSDESFSGEGAEAANFFARQNRAPRYRLWLASLLRPWVGQKVLELGAKTGHHTVAWGPRDLFWATDQAPAYLDSLANLTPSRPYLKVAACDPDDARSYPRCPGGFDTVFSLNELAVAKDPAAVLRNIAQGLAPGGRAIILVPQGPALLGSLDQAIGHRRRFRGAELEALCAQAGLRTVHRRQVNKVGAPLWWLNSRVLGRRSLGLLQIKLGDLLTPLQAVTDAVLPWPGMSLLLVAQKPQKA